MLLSFKAVFQKSFEKTFDAGKQTAISILYWCISTLVCNSLLGVRCVSISISKPCCEEDLYCQSRSFEWWNLQCFFFILVYDSSQSTVLYSEVVNQANLCFSENRPFECCRHCQNMIWIWVFLSCSAQFRKPVEKTISVGKRAAMQSTKVGCISIFGCNWMLCFESLLPEPEFLKSFEWLEDADFRVFFGFWFVTQSSVLLLRSRYRSLFVFRKHAFLADKYHFFKGSASKWIDICFLLSLKKPLRVRNSTV